MSQNYNGSYFGEGLVYANKKYIRVPVGPLVQTSTVGFVFAKSTSSVTDSGGT